MASSGSTCSRRHITDIGLTLALTFLALPAQADDCAFQGGPREAVDRALTAWNRLDAARIHAAVPVRPVIQVFDLKCQYE